MIYGKSGSGKSRSLLNFAEDEITLINVVDKRLPFSKKFRYAAPLNDITKIKAALSKMPTKVAVIDDAGYLMTNLFMAGHTKGDNYRLFNEIADTMWQLFTFIKTGLPSNVIVYIIMHETVSDLGESKLLTIGKLLDDKVNLSGLVTICLRCAVVGGRHVFITQSNGSDICKSPEGLWPDIEIANDLKMVDSDIHKFWDIE